MSRKLTPEEREIRNQERKEAAKIYREKNKDRAKEYRKQNAEYFKTKRAEWRQKHPEYSKDKSALHKIEKPNHSKEYYIRTKETRLAYTKKYRKENPEYNAMISSKRRAFKLKCTIINSENVINLIKEFYKEAVKLYKLDDIKRHVDHIIPLKHKNVCGLHVPWNLQILTAKENIIKNNTFDGTYDNRSWENNYLLLIPEESPVQHKL